MLRRTLIATRSYETNEIGWLLNNAPNSWEPVAANIVAHDILEHIENDSGTPEEEAMALGAVIYIRGLGGYWRNFNHQMMCGDCRKLKAGHYDQGPAHIKCDLVYFIESGILPRKMEREPLTSNHEEFATIVSLIELTINKSNADIVKANSESEEIVDNADLNLADNFREWMIEGAARCIARYENCDSFMLCSTFEQITNRLKNFKPEEGDIIELEIYPERAVVEVKYISIYDQFADDQSAE